MRVQRTGLTVLKGARHEALGSVDLAADGPVGDRVLCLVDRSRGRVLRTVENPGLLRSRARWESGVLSVDLDGRTLRGTPAATGEVLDVDYWGRRASVRACTGPWAAAFSAHLGLDVLLCRSQRPGEVVYGAPVSLVTTSSLRRLEEHLGRPVASERFRATVLVATGAAPAHVEDTWVGRTLRVGTATVLVRGLLPRCAVVDLDPTTGQRDAPVLRTLAAYRLDAGEITFGVDAVVLAPGSVRTGDPVLDGAPGHDDPGPDADR